MTRQQIVKKRAYDIVRRHHSAIFWRHQQYRLEEWRDRALAGVEGLRFHDLRHEFASRMAPKVEMHVLMKLLGHKSPAMVARYYNQTADDVSELARRLYGVAA